MTRQRDRHVVHTHDDDDTDDADDADDENARRHISPCADTLSQTSLWFVQTTTLWVGDCVSLMRGAHHQCVRERCARSARCHNSGIRCGASMYLVCVSTEEQTPPRSSSAIRPPKRVYTERARARRYLTSECSVARTHSPFAVAHMSNISRGPSTPSPPPHFRAQTRTRGHPDCQLTSVGGVCFATNYRDRVSIKYVGSFQRLNC